LRRAYAGICLAFLFVDRASARKRGLNKVKWEVLMLSRVICRIIISIGAITICCGCAALAAPSLSSAGSSASSTVASNVISNPSDFDYVGRSTRLTFLSPAALLAHNSWTEGEIIGEQCYFKTPDPLFLVPAENQSSWSFAGRLDSGNHFQALEYRSLLSLGLAGGNVQLNSWPVQLVSLADMPSLYLSERMALLNKAKLPADDLHKLAQDYIRRSTEIGNVVRRLENDYSPLECPHPTAG
jgi:hypothetical protein